MFFVVIYILKLFLAKPFSWEGAGTPLFSSSAIKTPATDDSQEKIEENEVEPHFDPIVPLPDKIEIVTGEEDEVSYIY